MHAIIPNTIPRIPKMLPSELELFVELTGAAVGDKLLPSELGLSVEVTGAPVGDEASDGDVPVPDGTGEPGELPGADVPSSPGAPVVPGAP